MTDTMLHDAIQNCSLDDVKKLIEKMDVNGRDDNDQTPLHYTHSYIYADAAKLLLEAGADIEACDNWDRTPLMNALQYGNTEAARFLMENGADFKRTSSAGRNALFHIASSLPKFCLSKPIDVKISGGKAKEITFYFRDDSFEKLNWKNVKKLKKALDDVVDDPDEQYRMIKDMIPERDRKDELMKLVDDFLAAGVRADAVDNDKGTTILMRAADANSPLDFVSLMVKNGADIKAKDKWKLTALHYAARKGHTDIAEYLIGAGADVNAQDDVGFTPLHEAADNDAIDTVQVLLSAGADKKAGLLTDYNMYKQGNTPYDIAERRNNKVMMKLLKPAK